MYCIHKIIFIITRSLAVAESSYNSAAARHRHFKWKPLVTQLSTVHVDETVHVMDGS